MDRRSLPDSSRKIPLRLPAAALMALLIIPGCGSSQSDGFVDYSQLDGGSLEPTDTEPADEAVIAANESQETTDAEQTNSPDSGTNVLPASDTVEVLIPNTSVRSSGDANLSTPRQVGYGSAAKSGDPLPIKLLVPDKQFRKENGALRANFDDFDLLKILNMQPVPKDAADHFPGWLSSLDGTRVRVRGYMQPTYQAEGLTNFFFVRDNGECCFGPNVAIYDLIVVKLAEGEETDYIQDVPFDVEGTFRISPESDEVELYALYFLDDAVIVK